MCVTIEVDLRHRFGPIRDQGARPTCLAFATSDAHASLRGTWDALSCEYAFYHAQKRSGRSPTKGAFLNDMLTALRDEGQPIEDAWPYLAQLPPDLSHYNPPSYVSELFGRNSLQPTHSMERICQALDDNA